MAKSAVATIDPTDSPESSGSRKRLDYFDRHQLPYVSPLGDNLPAPDPEGVARLDEIMMQVLTNDLESDGMSCVLYWFPADFVGPIHHHDSDQIIYVVEGSMSHGNRVMGPGAGFFTRAFAAYGFKAGPAGVKFLEFRPVTTFDTVMHDEAAEPVQGI